MSEVDLTAITQVSVGVQNGFGAGASASFGPALRLNDDKKTLLATQVYGVLGFNGEPHDKPVVITDAEGNSRRGEENDVAGNAFLEFGHKALTMELYETVRTSFLWGYRASRLYGDHFTAGFELGIHEVTPLEGWPKLGFNLLMTASPENWRTIQLQTGLGMYW
ncbi:MAG: hypothetical protein HYT77_01160 [Deltaproteobacteria bacterium]|nr:hypothetical protein [Deltaproteobacteria bacterium]